MQPKEPVQLSPGLHPGFEMLAGKMGAGFLAALEHPGNVGTLDEGRRKRILQADRRIGGGWF